MPSGIRTPRESSGGSEDHPLVLPVSLTSRLWAVLLAGASCSQARAHTEGLSLETEAASRWTQYQAKSVRLHEARGSPIVVRLVAGR